MGVAIHNQPRLFPLDLFLHNYEPIKKSEYFKIFHSLIFLVVMAEPQHAELFKFPRTRHLFDAGGSGVTRDDLLMDKGEENSFYTPSQRGRGGRGNGGASQPVVVSIEEKVDGANLGISIGKDMQIRVQNRSHFVNSSTHKQFSSLDSWLAEHSAALYSILEPDKHVLFGEWLYAKHSIHYTKLPGYFMAFDLYDREAQQFYSWRERNRRLQDTGIPVVRQITETTLTGRNDVNIKLINIQSLHVNVFIHII